LWNSGAGAVSLTGYTLYDDQALGKGTAFIIPMGTIVEADSYLVLCCGVSVVDDPDSGTKFGIGSKDTVTLVDANDAELSIVTLQGGGQLDVSYALDGNGEYRYTTSPTPDAENIFSASALPFDSSVAHQIEVTVSATDWAWLAANSELESYVAGNLTFDGYHQKNLIGIRPKGSVPLPHFLSVFLLLRPGEGTFDDYHLFYRTSVRSIQSKGGRCYWIARPRSL
jgi:hypothetical protein